MKYKGKGEHSVSQLETIIEELKEKLRTQKQNVVVKEINIGDFFLQKAEGGKILRKVIVDSDYSLDVMFNTFAEHGYYPISLSVAKKVALYSSHWVKIEIGLFK